MKEAAGQKNRRLTQRKQVSFTLTFGVRQPYSLRASLGLNDDLDALMLDLSETGVAFTSGFDLPVGADLDIKFNFINLSLAGEERSRSVELEAKIVSRKELKGLNYRIGASFVKISPQDREAIKYFIKRSANT